MCGKRHEDQLVSGNPVFHLVYLLPAILIHAADLSVIVQQQLAAVGVSSNHGAVIEGRQSPAVLVVRGSTQVQQRLIEKEETHTIPSVHTMEVIHTHTFSRDLAPVLYVSVDRKDHRSVSTHLSRQEVKLMLRCI